MTDSITTKSRLGLRGKWPYLVLILAGITADLWTKDYAFSQLSENQSRSVIDGFLYFVHVKNPGAVGGLFGGHPGLLVTLRLAVMAVLLYLVLKLSAKRWVLQLCFALIIAGAVGNLYDNLFCGTLFSGAEGEFGKVRDFIEVRLFFLPFDTIPGLMYDKRWNAFNIADAMIVCGAITLFLASFFGGPRKAPQRC